MKKKGKLVVILLMLLVINGGGVLLGERPASAAADTLTPQRLEQAIDLAAGYIVRNCDANGRFTYLVNIKPGVKVKPGYNIIRHAGAIYALCMYEQYRPDEKTRQAIRRAVGYLKQSIAPVDHKSSLRGAPYVIARRAKPDEVPRLRSGFRPKVKSKDEAISAVWEMNATQPYALLGGAGLGLVALMSAEKILPGTTPLEELRNLARFLLFMQKEDGSFYPSYIPSKEGRTNNYYSLFYPGESCLGLLMLYEKDPQVEWLQAAANGISYLARLREKTGRTQQDFWTLIAIAELPSLRGASPTIVEDDEAISPILRHAAAICSYAVSYAKRNFAFYSGSFNGDGRTTPTSAALEGLLAALAYLPEGYKSLKESIASIVKEGAEFILTGQVMAGEYAGGFLAKAPVPNPDKAAAADSDSEIRIDYVQHALCALLRYQEFFH